MYDKFQEIYELYFIKNKIISRLILYTSSNFFHRLKQAPPTLDDIGVFLLHAKHFRLHLFLQQNIRICHGAATSPPFYPIRHTRIRMGRRTRHIRRHTYACTIPYIRVYIYTNTHTMYMCVRTFARLLRASLSPWKRKITGNAKSIDAILGISRIRLSRKATMIFILNRKGPIRKKNRIVEG